MTTSKPYHGHDGAVAFKAPTVGPTAYVVTSLAGWAETHNRKAADAALALFVAPLDAATVLTEFRIAVSLLDEHENWDDVLGFLGQVTGTPKKLIPVIVGVALWGQYVVYEATEGAN